MSDEARTIELEDDDAVLVINGNRQIDFYLPELGDDDVVPEYIMYLTALAVFTKSDDEFVRDVLGKFQKMMDEVEDGESGADIEFGEDKNESR